MRFLVIGVDQLTGWPLAYPTSSATASEVIAFIKKHTIYSLGRPRLIISGNGPYYTASLLKKFLSKYSIDWKTVMAYASMSNSRLERMIRTIKGSIGKMVHCKQFDWDIAAPRVPYGYRRQGLVFGLSPSHLVHGESL